MSPLTNVRKGVNLVYYGLYCIVIGFLTVILSGVATIFSTGLATVLELAVPILVFVGIVLGMIGRIMCLSVPEEVKASWAIYAAVACDISAILANVGYYAGMVPGIFRLLAPVGFFLFVVFLKRLSSYTRDDVSEKRAHNVLKLFTGFIIAAIVLVLAVFLLPESTSLFYLLPILVPALVMLFAIVIIYVMLLLSLRETLSA